MSMDTLELETMRCEVNGHLARLRLNRPEALNAANWAWVQDLVTATDYLARSGETVPIYLPESAATSLPLLPAFPVVSLCIVTTREDLTETQPEALVATALGRVLSHR